jgi:hypothetical protein
LYFYTNRPTAFRQFENIFPFLDSTAKNGQCEGFTPRDVVNKVKKLRQKYKAEKDKKRRSGTGKGKEWKFFSKLDAFLSTKPNVEPLLVVDTMAESSTNDGTTRPETEETDDPVKGG